MEQYDIRALGSPIDFQEVTAQLTSASRAWQDVDDPPPFGIWMASSEVDQKFLGHFAAGTSHENPFLSGMLYKLLGLSVILSKKLLRARKLRRLDPTRETKSLQLYHHIIWLSREGLVITEQYVLPMVADYVELKVLAYKLRASFYHIFVLFHNQPSIRQTGIHNLPSSTSQMSLPNGAKSSKSTPSVNRDSLTATPPPAVTPEGGPVGGGSHLLPPGLGPAQSNKSTSSFLLPSQDYIPIASGCFNNAAMLAERLLPGSHPIRLSVKLEYAAFLYDCQHDFDSCRRLAKQAIADVYNAQEGMDDESFEDAAELVGILGKMIKRGNKTSSGGGSSTPGDARSRSEGSRGTPTRGLLESGGAVQSHPYQQQPSPQQYHQQKRQPQPPRTPVKKGPPPPKSGNQPVESGTLPSVVVSSSV
ncbi:hypothetical protein FQN54_001992 [Arachnomyces sp. PD_36]|nr:hypothetical protein FQN54_001992 [Arachnomyces sp. PD_36]